MKVRSSAFPCRQRLITTLITWTWVGFLSLCFGSTACFVKKTVRVVVPAKKLQVKSATLEELVALVNGYSEKIKSLSSTTMRLTFRSGKAESGQIQQYPRAPGYLLLQSPDELLLNIQNPLTKTTILELLSAGDDFSLWLPSKNQYFVGKNSTREFVLEGETGNLEFTARPVHILRAILPARIATEEPSVRVVKEEEQDANEKYYVVSVFHENGDRKLHLDRKLWFERSGLTITRQQTYEGEGEVAGIVEYSNLSSIQDILMPLSIKIDRPMDGYSLDMEFKDWRVNQQLPADAFIRHPPQGAQVLQLKEKQRSESRNQ